MPTANVHLESRSVLFSCVLCLICGLSASAQDEPAPAPVPLPVEGIRSQIIVTSDAGAVGPIFNMIEALPANGTVFSMSSMGSGSYDIQSLLHDPVVQKELELISSQKTTLRKLQDEFAKRQRDLMKNNFKGPIDRLTMENLRERQQALREEFEEKISETLLPHQSKRLKEVALYTQLDRQGAAGALSSKQLAEALGISEEQQARIREKAQAVKKQLEKEIAALKKQAQQDVLDELTPTQQKKLKELLGAEYKPATRRPFLPGIAPPVLPNPGAEPAPTPAK